VRTNQLALALAALVAPCLVMAGCSQAPRTEVVLVVDTDLRGSDGVDTFLVTVTSPEGQVQLADAMIADGALPRTLGLVYDGGRLGPFTAVVEGRRGVTPRLERTVRFTFQEGRTLMLRVDLLAQCVGTTCPAEQTCASGGCRAIDVGPEELVEWTGTPAPLDVDAGSDPVDAGPDPIDGGPDPIDGGGGCGGADLSSDEANCGTCGHACDFANGSGECVSGVCTVSACDAGWDDCNERGDDGCEADLNNAESTCGTCTTRCSGRDDTCCSGTCQRAC
jgi:hypothetical protein